MPEKKTINSWSLWSQSGGWKGRRTMEQRICGKRVLSLEWKREWVMVGDGGDEANDEVTCVRSDNWDKSDKSSWSAGRRSSLGSWFQRQGDAWRKELLMTFREEEEGGRERVMTRVLRWGWTGIRLHGIEGWVVVMSLYVRERIESRVDVRRLWGLTTARTARECWMCWRRFNWVFGRL